MRRRFLANLVTAIDDLHGRLTIVLTLRADCYHHPLAHAEFGARLGSSIVNVVALAPDEFEAAAEGPAARRGATLEPALVAELLTDVIGEPGALPIFQYALTELFDHRDGDVLTVAAYRAMGGVRGALSRRADDLYDGLSADQRAASRQLFLRLVTIGEHDDWGRRRVPAAELVSMDVDTVTMEAVISQFGRHRFLAFDRDLITGAPTVEVAHEALLREWALLSGWIEIGRHDVKRNASLRAAIGEWEQSESGRRLPADREPPGRVRPLEPGDVDAPDDAGAGLPRRRRSRAATPSWRASGRERSRRPSSTAGPGADGGVSPRPPRRWRSSSRASCWRGMKPNRSWPCSANRATSASSSPTASSRPTASSTSKPRSSRPHSPTWRGRSASSPTRGTELIIVSSQIEAVSQTASARPAVPRHDVRVRRRRRARRALVRVRRARGFVPRGRGRRT